MTFFTSIKWILKSFYKLTPNFNSNYLFICLIQWILLSLSQSRKIKVLSNLTPNKIIAKYLTFPGLSRFSKAVKHIFMTKFIKIMAHRKARKNVLKSRIIRTIKAFIKRIVNCWIRFRKSVDHKIQNFTSMMMKNK